MPELRAGVTVALRRAVKRCGRYRNFPTVLVGSDAEAARTALEKGYSNSAEFREILRQMSDSNDRGVLLETVRIPGEFNIADFFSRSLEERGPPSEDERRVSRESLQRAFDAIR